MEVLWAPDRACSAPAKAAEPPSRMTVPLLVLVSSPTVFAWCITADLPDTLGVDGDGGSGARFG